MVHRRRHRFLWISSATIILVMVAAVAVFFADRSRHYSFTIDNQIPITPVSYQGQSRLCWDYSGSAFFEAELLRQGKGEYDLSEMFVAYHGYLDRAQAAMQNHALVTFNPGGCIGDYLHCIEQYGLLPESEMPAPAEGPQHRQLANLILDFSQSNNHKGILKALDSAIGILPLTFTFGDSAITPKDFQHLLGINTADYIQLTSFRSHPYYQFMAIDCPDNWRHDTALNLPLDQFASIVDSALAHGYPVAWEADISEYNFQRHAQQGFITIPFTPHRKVSALERQLAWDYHRTTDDHVMLLFGTAHDQHGRPYYLVKNCWGCSGPYHGILFVSKAYFRYKTVNILLHRNAIPKNLI